MHRKRPWQRGKYYLAQNIYGYWEIRWNDPARSRNGPRCKSTGARVVEEAIASADDWYERNAKFSHEAPENLALGPLFMGFLAQEKPKGKSGFKIDKKGLIDVLEVMMEIVPKPMVADLEVDEHQEALIEKLRTRGLIDSTIRRKIGPVRRALKWAMRRKKIRRQIIFPTNEELELDRDQERDAFFTIEQAAAFYRAIDCEYLAAFFIVGMNTGARSAAIYEMMEEDIDFDRGVRGLIDLQRFTSPDLRKRHGVIPITKTLAPWLISRKDGYIVGRKKKYIGPAWNAALKRARLEDADLTPHVMRHTVSSELAGRDVPDNQIKFWFAQSVGKKGYTHRLTYRSDYLAGAIAALDGFMGEIEIALKSEKDRTGIRSLSPETLADA